MAWQREFVADQASRVQAPAETPSGQRSTEETLSPIDIPSLREV
jgi:hypothetical protein